MNPTPTIDAAITNPMDMDQSPNSMAAAAYAAAVAERERQDMSKRSIDVLNNDTDGLLIVRPYKVSRDTEVDDDYSIDKNQIRPQETGITSEERIQEIWKLSNDTESKMSDTLRLLMEEIDSLMQCGLVAFQDADTASRQLMQSKELLKTKSREAQRMQEIDKQSRESLSNLLRAVESSKSVARKTCDATKVEVHLRASIRLLSDERDKALMELSDYRRKLSLQEEELRLTKSKLSRMMQEKSSIERDSRAAISLARSLDSNNSNDLNYYKRKVNELSDKLQAEYEQINRQKLKIPDFGEQPEGFSLSQREKS